MEILINLLYYLRNRIYDLTNLYYFLRKLTDFMIYANFESPNTDYGIGCTGQTQFYTH